MFALYFRNFDEYADTDAMRDAVLDWQLSRRLLSQMLTL